MTDALVDLSPDPLWVLDREGVAITFNSAFQRWWHDLSGCWPTRNSRPDGATQQIAEIQQRALSGRSIMANVRFSVAAAERTFTLYARPIGTGGAAFTVREAVLEGERAERGVELALLHLFASGDPLDSLLARTLEFLCATEHWDAATLWRIEGDVLRAHALWFESDDARLKLAPRIESLALRRGEGPPGRAWASGEVVWIADMFDESTVGRVAIASASGLHSVVATPLIDDQRITGVLELFTRAVRPISEPTKRMLARTGAALARLIERRSLVDEIARKGAEWLLTVDSISTPILLVDSNACVVRLNRTAHELTNVTYRETVGHPLASLGAGEPWKTLTDLVTAVHESAMLCTAEVSEGERTWEVTASPLSAAAADDDRVVIVMRDTTELRRLQESVRRGEQLAALGELVAGVAHEVKNPLFGMSLTLDLLEEQFPDRNDALELIAALRKWIARLQSLTENLLAFGRTWTIELVPGELTPVVMQAIATIEPLAGEAGVVIDAQLEPSSETLLMDASRLVLVFENMLANAVQHSRAGDRVEISMRRDGELLIVAVRDHGAGFQPADLARVFQPFFTRRRGGTGLGLSIVQRIVDEHGGTVAATNAETGGAVVLVQLPVYAATTRRA